MPVVCFANQLIGFYMRATLAFNGLIHLNLRNITSETSHVIFQKLLNASPNYSQLLKKVKNKR